MLSVVLYVVVAAVAIAAGRNVFVTADAASRDEGEVFGVPERFHRLDVWRNRSVGVLLIALGCFMAVGAVASSWRLVAS